MNKWIIIGNLTRDPEMRKTTDGRDVCHMTVAVNRKGKDNRADYVSVSSWGQLGANCAQYLSKGRKVCCVGTASPTGYIGQDGSVISGMNMDAETVEFLDTSKENRTTE